MTTRQDVHREGGRLRRDRRRGRAACKPRARLRAEDDHARQLQARSSSASRCSRSATPAARAAAPSTAQGIINAMDRSIQASDNGQRQHGEPARHAADQRADPGGRLRRPAGQRAGARSSAWTPPLTARAAPGPAGGHHRVRDPDRPRRSRSPSRSSAGRPARTVHLGRGRLHRHQRGPDAGRRPARAAGFGAQRRFRRAAGAPANSGAFICQVFPGTPADSAGLTGAT